MDTDTKTELQNPTTPEGWRREFRALTVKGRKAFAYLVYQP